MFSQRCTLFFLWTVCGGVAVWCLSVSAVLVGRVGVDSGPVWLLSVFAGWHPLVYPVQATRLLEVANLPRGRETLNGCRRDEKTTISKWNPNVSPKLTGEPHMHWYKMTARL